MNFASYSFLSTLGLLWVQAHRRHPRPPASYTPPTSSGSGGLDIFIRGLRPVRPAQARPEAPGLRKVPEHRMPAHFTALIRAQHDRLDVIVEDLCGHAPQVVKGFLVLPQQGLEFLVGRQPSIHGAGVPQRQHKAPDRRALPLVLERAQMAPIGLRLLARWGLKPPHGHRASGFPLGLQLVFEDRVPAGVAVVAQLPQQDQRIPDARA